MGTRLFSRDKALASATRTKIEAEFLRTNLERRQLDILAKARVALRYLEIERNRPRFKYATGPDVELRDRVGLLIGLSGRHLARVWRVLQTPVEIQNAVRAKKLPIVMAEKVSYLPPEKQNEIARRLPGAKVPRNVVKEYVRDTNAPKVKSLIDYLCDFIRAIPGEENSLAEFTPKWTHYNLSGLEKGQAVLKRIIAMAADYDDTEDRARGSAP